MTLFSASISSKVYLPFSYFFHTASLAPMSRHHKKMVYRVFLDRRGEIVFILASFPPPTFDLIYMYGGHSKTICLGASCQDSLTPVILSWSTTKTQYQTFGLTFEAQDLMQNCLAWKRLACAFYFNHINSKEKHTHAVQMWISTQVLWFKVHKIYQHIFVFSASVRGWFFFIFYEG